MVLAGTTLAEARACAEKVRESVANTSLDTSAGPVRVTVSIRVSGLEEIVDRNLATVQSLLRHPDARDRVTLSNLN